MPTTRIKLQLPRGPLFVGTYARIPVSITPASGLAFDDLEFMVPDGAKAGQISASRERAFDPRKPEIMLLVGFEPGTYRIRVYDRRSHTLLKEEPYEVTGLWRKKSAGPSFWFSGQMESYGFGAWGGGPLGPQNINVHPAPPTMRLAVVMIDFTDQLYPTVAATLQDYRDQWHRSIVTGTVPGALYSPSVRNFYREASYGKFDLICAPTDIHGPVHLNGTWKDFYRQIASPDGRWLVQEWQALITGVQAALDLSQYDTVLFVPPKGAPVAGDEQWVENGTLQPAPRAAWAVAALGKRTFTTNQGLLAMGVISMSNEWASLGEGPAHASLAHEMGHTLGLLDQYFNPPSLAPRKAGTWDLMAGGGLMPCFCLAHRMMLGWVPPGAVRSFDFATAIGPVNQLVTLHPSELPPPTGGLLGVEVRIADGLNYYFEYRKAQPMQSGDGWLSTLMSDNVVLGTDVASAPPATTRAQILTLPGKVKGLADGTNYEETDVSATAWPGTFRAEVSGVTGTTADVRISYGVNGKPDPAIRPWPAGPDRVWQSPDIEVRNLRNLTDPDWFNVPWLGHTNTIVATITNRGNIPAPLVRADFFIKDYTVTDAPETYLGTNHQNMAAGGVGIFTMTWTPEEEGHYCVVVRIPHYTPPMAPDLGELTDLNNVAQSNYERFISASGSPARRVVTRVTVQNPYLQRTRLYLSPGQSNPLYRTYLRHTWVELEAGESRQVELMFEYGPVGEPEKDAIFGARNLRKFAALPNDVNLVGLLENPHDPHVIEVRGGAQARIVTGKDTQIEGLQAGKTMVRGRVTEAAKGRPVARGKVLVTLWAGRGRKRREIASFVVALKKGAFRGKLEGGWTELEAYYLPAAGYGDCSARLGLETGVRPSAR